MLEKIKNIKMTWLKVIIMALAFGAGTAAIALIPIFKGTSIYNIAVCFEFWFIPAVLIGINCKKPLEAALKVFVFFLISQPLVYLIQMPFSTLSAGDFLNYYKYWLVWTFLMLPGGVMVWLGTKKSWVGLLDAVVASAFLFFIEFPNHFSTLLKDGFPNQLLACIFILVEVVFIILIFAKEAKQRVIAFICAVLLCFGGLYVNKAHTLKTHTSSCNIGEGEYTVSYCDDGAEATVEGGKLTIFAKDDGNYSVKIKNANGEERSFNYILKDDVVEIIEAE
ncbi:MAG: hypothetical protein MJ120_03760 [Clostridia bacterium]|nr:hypothetical protein [Clostridia bacterium]